MTNTNPYSDFQYNFGRLNGFFTEICENEPKYKEPVIQLARELALLQLIAMADVYRNDLMVLLLRSNPSLFKLSKEKLSIPEIAQHRDWPHLLDELIRKELGYWTKDMAYERWIVNLRQDLLSGISLDNQTISCLSEIIARRNSLAHKRGIVDEEYLRRSSEWYKVTGLSKPNIGMQLVIDGKYFRKAAHCLRVVIEAVDNEAIKYI